MKKTVAAPWHVTASAVRRYLGYPDAARIPGDVQQSLDRVMEVGPALLSPACCCECFPVMRVTSSAVDLAGEVRFTSADLARRLRRARELAAFVVTVGPRLEEESERLMRCGDVLQGYALDAFASAAVYSLAGAAQESIEADAAPKGYRVLAEGVCIGRTCPAYRDCGGAIIHWWSPGYGDWNVVEVRKLLALLEADRIGVRSDESGMMTPRKSYAGTMALGPLAEPVRNRCIEWQRAWTQYGMRGR